MKSVKFVCVFLLLCFAIVPVFAQDGKKIDDGFWRYYKPVERTRSLADRSSALEQDEGGVLFMTAAQPEDASVLQDPKKPISLSYNKNGKDGARLTVTVDGKKIVVKNLYDWILLPAARYADSGYTNGITLLGEIDQTNSEEASRADFYRKRNGTDVYWVEANPALFNTFVGLNMLMADVMFINSDTGKATANIVLPGYNDAKLNKKQQEAAAKAASTAKNSVQDVIVKARQDRADKKAWAEVYAAMSKRESMPTKGDMDAAVDKLSKAYFEDALPWDSYIFCDPDDGIKFKIDEKKNLVFSGEPQYYFLYKNIEAATGKQVYEDAKDVTADMNKIVRNLNPAVYNTLTQAAQWTAFFRLAKNKYPGEWKKFVAQIKPNVVNPEYSFATPSVFDANTKELKDAYSKTVEANSALINVQ